MMLPADEVLPDVLPVAAPSNPPNTLAMVELVLLLAAAVLAVDVVVAAVAEVVAPVVASTEVDVDFLVEVLVVDFLVVLVVDFFEEDFLVDFFVVFFTGINSELEALSAASFMAQALLPAVHASTRAAIRITFFILLSFYFLYYLILIPYILYRYPRFRGAKFGIFWEITKRNPLFFSSSFPIFPIHPLFIISIPSNYPARFIDGWGCRWFIQMLIFVQNIVQMIHLFDLNQKRMIITPKISNCAPKYYQNVISLQH